jgi:tetratricopeptide (TPR) repeat protein
MHENKGSSEEGLVRRSPVWVALILCAGLAPRVAHLEPQSAQVHNSRGSALVQKGKVAEAEAEFREALKLDPNSVFALDHLAQRLASERRYAAAVRYWKRALALQPDSPAMASSMHAAELKHAKNMKSQEIELKQLALDVAQDSKGGPDVREKRLEAAIASDPELVSAVGDLGIIRANKGDVPGAEKLFREAIEDDPNFEQGHVNLGLLLARQQKFSEAEAEVDQAVKLAPSDPIALAAAGRVKARLGKSVEGVALLRRVVALAPQSPTAHLELGMVLADSYDLAGALAETDEAVRLAPGSALTHFNRGRVLFDLGRNAEAQPELESARSIDEQMPEPYYFLAMIEKQAGHYQRAVTLLQTVVRLQPRNATAWHLLGQSLEQQSQTQAAIAAWRQAVAIQPNYTQALWSLARAIKPINPDESARLMARYSEVQKERHIVDEAGTLGNDALAAGAAHDWPEAIAKFHQAIEVCGDCAIKADLHKKLGLTVCQMGDIDDGERELRLARALKPDDPDVERALERIAAARRKRVALHPDSPKGP